MKKIIILVLALTLCMALCAPVFAADDGAITVDSFEELLQAVNDVKPGGTINVTAPKSNPYFRITETISIGNACTINFKSVNFFHVRTDEIPSKLFKGSFIEVNADNTTLNFNDCYFNTSTFLNKKNPSIVSNAWGSAICVNGNNCVIEGNGWTHFERCSTTARYGGAIFVNDDCDNCHINGCRFCTCQAAWYGGAIYASADGCIVSNCQFVDCRADGVDSRVYSEEWHQTTLLNCTDVFNVTPCDENNCPRCVFDTAEHYYRTTDPDSYMHPYYPEDGYYQIYTAMNDALCLEIDDTNGGYNEADNLRLGTAASWDTKQIFKIEKDKNCDAYKIMSVKSGKVLDVAGASTAEGANIYQWTENGGDNQRWVFENDPGNGRVYIHSKQSTVTGSWMDVAEMRNAAEANVYSWSYTGAENQMWVLKKVEYNAPEPPVYPEKGFYKIYSALDGNYCLDISGGAEAKSDGDNLHLWPVNTAAANIFYLEKDEDKGAYIIRAVHSGKILDVFGTGSAPGANIMQWNDDSAEDQRWIFKDADGNGHYYIHTMQNGYMDVQNGAAYEDANVFCTAYGRANSQMWVLEQVDDPNKPVETNPPVVTVKEVTLDVGHSEEGGVKVTGTPFSGGIGWALYDIGKISSYKLDIEVPENCAILSVVMECGYGTSSDTGRPNVSGFQTSVGGTNCTVTIPDENVVRKLTVNGVCDPENAVYQFVERVTVKYSEASPAASTLSEGNVWIICAIGAAAVVAVGAIVIVKKKKTAEE